ncbi:MAG: hypothetical protein H0X14_09075 [Acidobacteria bacterium]|nr:hypothetical protein [Acidobacteriota bacterium]
MRKGPFRRSAPELVRALRRIDEVRALEVNVAVSSHVPPGRIQALARFATTAKASALARLPPERRLATLVAFVMTLEATALDDALDLLDILITEIFSDATKADEKARLRSIKDLDAAATQLGQVCRLVLDANIPDAELRAVIWNTMKSEELEAALTQMEALVRPPKDMYYQELRQSWRRVRRFLPPLLKTIHFGSTPAGRALDGALQELSTGAGVPIAGQEHLDIVSKGWRRYVVDDKGAVDQKAYVFCCLERLRSALRRRDLFVAPSLRYADARRGLLSGKAWETARPMVCRSLGHTLSAEDTIVALSRQLDETYRAVAANLPANPSARIETVAGKDELVVSGLDKLEEPPSLVRLRDEVSARLPLG